MFELRLSRRRFLSFAFVHIARGDGGMFGPPPPPCLWQFDRNAAVVVVVISILGARMSGEGWDGLSVYYSCCVALF